MKSIIKQWHCHGYVILFPTTFYVRVYHDAAVMHFANTRGQYLINFRWDATVISPPPLGSLVCTGLHHDEAETEAPASAPPHPIAILHSAYVCRGLVTAAGDVRGIAAPASLHPSLQHPFLTSIPALLRHTPFSQTGLFQHLCMIQGCSQTVTSRARLSLCVPTFPSSDWAETASIPLFAASPQSIFRGIVGQKTGKLSLLPSKVSLSWAAGLPLSLWRMILWMKTEEMALGELMERLRTVTNSIGGWPQHTHTHNTDAAAKGEVKLEYHNSISTSWLLMFDQWVFVVFRKKKESSS